MASHRATRGRSWPYAGNAYAPGMAVRVRHRAGGQHSRGGRHRAGDNGSISGRPSPAAVIGGILVAVAMVLAVPAVLNDHPAPGLVQDSIAAVQLPDQRGEAAAPDAEAVSPDSPIHPDSAIHAVATEAGRAISITEAGLRSGGVTSGLMTSGWVRPLGYLCIAALFGLWLLAAGPGRVRWRAIRGGAHR